MVNKKKVILFFVNGIYFIAIWLKKFEVAFAVPINFDPAKSANQDFDGK